MQWLSWQFLRDGKRDQVDPAERKTSSRMWTAEGPQFGAPVAPRAASAKPRQETVLTGLCRRRKIHIAGNELNLVRPRRRCCSGRVKPCNRRLWSALRFEMYRSS